MSDFVMFIGGLVGLLLTVLWILSMLATLRLREDVATLTRCVYERHGWDVRERKRALRPQDLLRKNMAEDVAIAMVDRELPIG
jgi:hypothetical protein